MYLSVARAVPCEPRMCRSVHAVARPAGISAVPARPVATPRRHVAATRRVAVSAVSPVAATTATKKTDTLADSMLPFSGCNCYYLLEKMNYDDPTPEEHGLVLRTLRAIRAMGFSVIRIWAYNDGDDANRLQTAPGVINQTVLQRLKHLFRLLDKVNNEDTSKPPMKFMMTLTNHRDDNYGGLPQMMRWHNRDVDDFYSCGDAQDDFDNYVGALIDHFTGTRYFDLIHSWDICNEPRNCHNEPEKVTAWVKRVAKIIKDKDKVHPVTVGLEGFYGDPDHFGDNPYNMSEGVSWLDIGKLKDIDFMSIHLWPDKWKTNDPNDIIAWSEKWITCHMAVCRDHLDSKPLVLQEYNISVDPDRAWEVEDKNLIGKKCRATQDTRQQLFAKVRELMAQSKSENYKILRGTMVWMIADGTYASGTYASGHYKGRKIDQEGHMIVHTADIGKELKLEKLPAEQQELVRLCNKTNLA